MRQKDALQVKLEVLKDLRQFNKRRELRDVLDYDTLGRKLNKLVLDNNLILVASEIDLEEAGRIGIPVVIEGKTFAYYLEDGFYEYSCYCSPLPGNFSMAYRISGILSFLNPDVDSEILLEYLDTLCKRNFDTDNVKIDRMLMLKNINSVKKGTYIPSGDIKKFFFLNNNIDYVPRYQIVNQFLSQYKRKQHRDLIRTTIDCLTTSGNIDASFITKKDVAKASELSYQIVNRNIESQQYRLDTYNLSNFNTTNFKTYIRFENIHTISAIIRSLHQEGKKVTQKTISEISGLNKDTVTRLCKESEIQMLIK